VATTKHRLKRLERRPLPRHRVNYDNISDAERDARVRAILDEVCAVYPDVTLTEDNILAYVADYVRQMETAAA
jgi:hypothetical protein